jgi:hypothetical protein
MKTKSHTLIAATLLLVTTFMACQKDNSIRPMPVNVSDKSEMYQEPERGPISVQNNSDFEEYLIKTDWLVKVYNDGKLETRTDQTHYFNGFTFDFNEHHVVIAKGKERNLVGKWNTYMVGSQKKIALSFGFTPCIMLNEEWIINNYSSRAIDMDCPKGLNKSLLVLHNSGNLPK